MVNAVAAAYAEKSPVVVLSGAPGKGEARRGLLLHHQAKTLDSQYQIYSEITCDQARLDDAAARAGRHRARAAQLPARIRSRCTSSCRATWWRARASASSRAGAAAVDAEALAACVDEILERLAAAKSPVLMVGVEVRRYGLEAQGRRARAPPRPAGGDELHGPRPAGRSPMRRCSAPTSASPATRRSPQLVEDSDALLLLGVILSDTNFGVSARADRPAQDDPGARRAGDARLPHLSGHPARRAGRRAARAMPCRRAGCRSSRARRIRAASSPTTTPITPNDIATAVNDLMAEHGRDADRLGHGRLPVHRDGHREHRAGRARLLRDHGLRRARRARAAGRDRASGR